MDARSQLKVIRAGFTIIRQDDYPAIRIKYKDADHEDWVTYNNYPTKSARDKVFNELREASHILID